MCLLCPSVDVCDKQDLADDVNTFYADKLLRWLKITSFFCYLILSPDPGYDSWGRVLIWESWDDDNTPLDSESMFVSCWRSPIKENHNLNTKDNREILHEEP